MTPADDPTPDETPAPTHHATEASAHPDPITGEPGAHPIGVGVGAAGAGIAGAVIGMVAGPVGALIGAAIGAVAGGLAGKEVAAGDEDPLPADAEPFPAGAEPPVSATGAPGFEVTGIPAGNLMAAAGADLREADAAGEGRVAGSNVEEPTGVTAGQFHDAFTATTLHETEAENRLADDEAAGAYPDAASLPEGTSSGALSGMAAKQAPEHDEHIRQAAFYRFLDRQRNGVPGDELGDWVRAEKDLPAV